RGRQAVAAQARGDFVRGDLREAVLFVLGPVAEAVLEIDPEVFHRLARQLVDHARVDAVGDGLVEADGGGQRLRIRRVLLQRAQRAGAELARGVGLEQVGAAVDDVHRLAPRRVARKLAGRADVGFVERVDEGGERVLRDAGAAHTATTAGAVRSPNRSS